jgi:hypothetical protein
MRGFGLLILLVTILLLSCEKQDFQHKLVGKWRIIGSGGGIGGQGDSYNFSTLVLDRKERYKFLRSNSIVETGDYLISDNETNFGQEYWEFQLEFKFDSRIDDGAAHLSPGALVIQMISSDSLCLAEPFADGFGWCFVRMLD